MKKDFSILIGGKPGLILEKLGIEPSWRVTDVGASGGYFAFRFAEEVEKVE